MPVWMVEEAAASAEARATGLAPQSASDAVTVRWFGTGSLQGMAVDFREFPRRALD